MAEIPNLAGVAPSELVETIGTGSYKASYINWARTVNLLHEHAPGWALEMVPAPDGGLVHRAPGTGGWLMLRWVHVDGTVRPAYPQSLMDNRNKPIPVENITSRDITDTHRRGLCMAAAMEFGLAYELWAKMPLESGYSSSYEEQEGSSGHQVQSTSINQSTEATQTDFLEACLAKGLNTFAAEALLGLIGENYSKGLKTLAGKDEQWVREQNEKTESTPKTAKPQAKKTTSRRDPDSY